MSVVDVLYTLRSRGFRVTKIRSMMVEALARAPLSVQEIQTYLAKSKLTANKTTVYRALTFLQDEKLIREIQLSGEKKKRYELATDEHHHHVVCVKCDRIEDVAMKKELEQQEKYIARNQKFKILNHSLEFYGICKTCSA